MAYSMDYRKRAVEYKDKGHTFKELREAFNIPPETYYNWKKKLKSNYYETKQPVERPGKINKQALINAVEKKPDAYLRELAEPFNCTPGAVFRMLKKLNVTYKKKHLLIQKNQKKVDKNS
jgi:transposase